VKIHPDTKEIVALVDRMKPLLAGCKPEVQGGALADLLATWLAGHHVEDDEDATRTMRADLMRMHFDAVTDLVPINARIMGTTP
jgi:hypothetical protein